MKSRYAALALGLVVALSAACSSNNNNAGNTGANNSANKPATQAAVASRPAGATAAARTPTPIPTIAAAPGAVSVTFWHAFSGTNGDVLQTLVNNYNKSQQKVHVDAVFQGSYDDTIVKLRQAITTKTTPDIVQMYDIGTKFMIDSKAATPMQQFIDQDKYDLSQFEPNVLGYYKSGSTLYSMPWNSSNPIVYINADMFKAAGLDPSKPPQTWEDFTAAAKALTKGDVKGFGVRPYGWFFEQELAIQGALYGTPDNGRQGSPATKAVFNGPEGVNFINWWNDMLKGGTAVNLGNNGNDVDAAFAAGKVAMVMDSTAALKGILNMVGSKFQVGTGFMPHPASNPNAAGTIIGGASLWILNGHPTATQAAAWDFIKYLMAPEQEAYFHINTGYYPPSKAAYDVQSDKDWVKQYPQFQTAVDQLHASPFKPATQGALIGTFTQSRADTEDAMTSVFNGQATAQQALDKTAAKVTDEITQYNQAVH